MTDIEHPASDTTKPDEQLTYGYVFPPSDTSLFRSELSAAQRMYFNAQRIIQERYPREAVPVTEDDIVVIREEYETRIAEQGGHVDQLMAKALTPEGLLAMAVQRKRMDLIASDLESYGLAYPE